MNTYFISDLHLGHANCMKFAKTDFTALFSRLYLENKLLKMFSCDIIVLPDKSRNKADCLNRLAPQEGVSLCYASLR